MIKRHPGEHLADPILAGPATPALLLCWSKGNVQAPLPQGLDNEEIISAFEQDQKICKPRTASKCLDQRHILLRAFVAQRDSKL